jgi:hypothetical protein
MWSWKLSRYGPFWMLDIGSLGKKMSVLQLIASNFPSSEGKFDLIYKAHFEAAEQVIS